MKILTTTAGGIVRGIESWPEYGLARELVKRGHKVTAFSSISVKKVFKDAKAEETIEGIQVKRFNPISPESMLKAMKGEWDLIHTQHLGYLAPISSYAALAAKSKKIPTVFTVHGLYHDPFIVKDVQDPFANPMNFDICRSFPAQPWKIPDWFVHLPMYSAKRVTALTKWEKKELVKFGVDEDRISVVPNGLYTAKFAKAKTKAFKDKLGIDGPMLLFVGQPIRRKGPEYLIQALPKIAKQFPDITCVFAGYKSNPELEALCERLGVSQNIKFLGFLSEEDKIAAMKSADAFVFPTLYEGFGIPLIEAMAAGCPIVTTRVAGVPELVKDGYNGLLVEPKSSEGIASAVVKLLKSKKMRASMSKANVNDAKKYEWKNVAKLYEQAFEDAAEANE